MARAAVWPVTAFGIADTWGGESWKTDGAPIWTTGTYDPELNLIYWGTGNPGPDHNGDQRPGDNLYSSSVIAPDADTGELRWHYQFTPHDEWDWDSSEVPVLVDMAGKAKCESSCCLRTATAFTTSWIVLPVSFSRQNLL